jgi:hypothetical protein
VLLNFLLNSDNLWFPYVAATSFLVWVVFVFPFITEKRKPYLMWGFDSLATALYIFVFYALNSKDEGWYFSIAIPSIAITSACTFFYIHWYRQRKRHWSSKVLHGFVDVTIILSILVVCLILNGYVFGATITPCALFPALLSYSSGYTLTRAKKYEHGLQKRCLFKKKPDEQNSSGSLFSILIQPF